MDTEKKVQFVALTKEEIDAMIQQAALAGAQVASDAMMVGQRKSEKEKIDRRLHNTDLLLRNYRTLKASYENAVYKSKEGEVTEVLEDIMTMKDDKRIDFVGGIRGLGELERRCSEDCVLAFSMYATSISELFAVADAGRLMPPKSTWFEPKLRSGLFLHML